MKFLKIILLINIFFIIVSCGTVKEAFTNQKKNSADEFLVEKKSPLIIPPDFDKLPIPNDKENASEIKGNQIKKLLSKDQTEIKNSSTSKNFKESILEKIKKN